MRTSSISSGSNFCGPAFAFLDSRGKLTLSGKARSPSPWTPRTKLRFVPHVKSSRSPCSESEGLVPSTVLLYTSKAVKPARAVSWGRRKVHSRFELYLHGPLCSSPQYNGQEEAARRPSCRCTERCQVAL
jgi:hypothetical protein